MLAAISQRNEKHDIYGYRDILENNYINFYEGFGIRLIPIPNSSKNVKEYFKDLPIKGIILTGGGDVNPRIYNQKPVYAKNFSELRDSTEKSLLEVAIERGLPVFCNCRGFQFMNVFFGGSLVQSIQNELKQTINHKGTFHKVSIADKKILRALHKDSFIVNSYHDQAVNLDNLAEDLVVFARAQDGIVEGAYHKNYPMAGVQWHPEREGYSRSIDKKLIKAFIKKELFWKK